MAELKQSIVARTSLDDKAKQETQTLLASMRSIANATKALVTGNVKEAGAGFTSAIGRKVDSTTLDKVKQYGVSAISVGVALEAVSAGIRLVSDIFDPEKRATVGRRFVGGLSSIPGVKPLIQFGGFLGLRPSQSTIDMLSEEDLSYYRQTTGRDVQYSKEKQDLEIRFDALQKGLSVADQLQKAALSELQSQIDSGLADPELIDLTHQYMIELKKGSISYYKTVAEKRIRDSELKE